MAGTVTSIVMVRDSFAIKRGGPSLKAVYLPEDSIYNVGEGEEDCEVSLAVQLLNSGEAAPHTIDGNLFDTAKPEQEG